MIVKWWMIHLISFSKKFYCISCNLVLVKLDTCGFNLKSLRLIHNYLSNKQGKIQECIQLEITKAYLQGQF